MKLEVFTAIIEAIEKQSEISIEAAKLGIDLLDYEENWITALTLALGAYYGETGSDWIGWYVFERDNEESQDEADDSCDNKICYDIPSLWKHVEELRVSESFKELELPIQKELSEKDLFNLFSGKRLG